MEIEAFLDTLQAHTDTLAQIEDAAHSLHASVGQTYDGDKPYAYHLDMVADAVRCYGAEICQQPEDVLPILFAAYFHDSIEDARQTYNDTMKTARRFMTETQALMATEIVYALTNDKGRTRAERAGEHYYEGIRQTPYAPFIKLCDRLANASYSARGSNEDNNHMHEVYHNEMPEFLEHLQPTTDDPRMSLPQILTMALRAM